MNVLYRHYSLVPEIVWPWTWFKPREIACRGTGELLLVPYAMDVLTLLHSTLGKPLIINSAYRSALHNARVGGAPKSEHKEGHAFDISLANQDRDELLQAARAVGFRGTGFYKMFLHVDLGPIRQWGKW